MYAAQTIPQIDLSACLPVCVRTQTGRHRQALRLRKRAISGWKLIKVGNAKGANL